MLRIRLSYPSLGLSTHKKSTRYINFTGTLKIKWMEMEAGSMIPFEEFQMLLNDKVDIFRVNRKKPQEAWIFPGKHVYE